MTSDKLETTNSDIFDFKLIAIVRVDGIGGRFHTDPNVHPVLVSKVIRNKLVVFIAKKGTDWNDSNHRTVSYTHLTLPTILLV